MFGLSVWKSGFLLLRSIGADCGAAPGLSTLAALAPGSCDSGSRGRKMHLIKLLSTTEPVPNGFKKNQEPEPAVKGPKFKDTKSIRYIIEAGLGF